jgi:predicted nucleic acid-binding Zn ribbon protein
VVPRVLEELGLGAAARSVELARRWPELVGAELARHSEPALLRGAVLEVTVDASVWAQELKVRQPEILERLGHVLGPAAPSELRLRIGSLG